MVVSTTSGLGVEVVGRRGGGTVGGGGRSRYVTTRQAGGVLAGESSELVTLATLGNRDAVLVEPLLDLAIAPAVKELVGKRRLGRLSRLGGSVVLLAGLRGSDVGVAADGRDELVTVTGLRCRDTALVEPCLQVRVGPLRVDPVTRVARGLAGLVRCGLVVGADSMEERVASARSRVRDAVVVEERLELRLGPAGVC